jgi:photosystem II PsbU protein
MKRLVSVLLVVGLMVGCLGWLSWPQKAIAASFDASSMAVLAEVEVKNTVDEARARVKNKVDLNNTNVRAFINYPGMYPNLARLIINYSPFDEVEDVLDMPGLTEAQKATLEKYLDDFTVNPPVDALVEGGDRFNNGIYR